jgi:hypothetical protein
MGYYCTGDTMISLKKNDKIIVVVAIAVLLTASIGIALYTSPEPAAPSSPPSSPGEKTFGIIWAERNGTLNTISEFAGKRTPYSTTVQISEGNLQTITFNLTWIDDRATLLKRRGLDTLTLEVTTPDGQVNIVSNTSEAKTKEGHILLTVPVDNVRPPDTLKANDIQSAQAKLNQKPYYSDAWTGQDINITVSVKIGEIRILPRLFDKGNDFDLKISYQYYEGTISKYTPIIIDTNKFTSLDDNPPKAPQDDQEIPPYMSMIINTGCGRFV